MGIGIAGRSLKQALGTILLALAIGRGTGAAGVFFPVDFPLRESG